MKKKLKVILDCDMAIGHFASDIDDAFAYIWLKEEVKLLGITCVHGNARQKVCYAITNKMTKLLKDDVKVYRGAYGKKDLGKRSEATDFILDMAEQYKNELVIVAVGPLTNIASAAMLDSDFSSKVKQLVIMGGFDKKKPAIIHTEFNFFSSPLAAKIVCESDIEKIFAPTDVCLKVLFSKEDANRLNSETQSAKFIKKSVKRWINLTGIVSLFNILPKGGFVPWDPIAAAGLTHIEKFSFKRCEVRVNNRGVSRFFEDESSKNVVLTDCDKEWFITELIDKINRATE